MKIDELIGTWKLCSYELKSKDGECYYLYGNNPKGYLLYDKNGYMSGMISKSDRTPISRGDIHLLPVDEKLSLTDGFYAYSGKYELLKDKILHKIEVSFIPNLVSTIEERYFEIVNNKMILSTPPVMIKGKEFTFYITWEKI